MRPFNIGRFTCAMSFTNPPTSDLLRSRAGRLIRKITADTTYRMELRGHRHCPRSFTTAARANNSHTTVNLSDAAGTIYGGASNTNDPSWEFNPDWGDRSG